MQIKMYNNVSYKNQLNKQLLDAVSFSNAKFKGDVNIINPVLIISNTSETLSKNYIYIDDLNRYYFIDDIVVLDKNRLEISCSVDVLETYKNEIIMQTAIVERNALKANFYLNDDKYPIRADRQIITKSFPQGFTQNGKFILMIAGD